MYRKTFGSPTCSANQSRTNWKYLSFKWWNRFIGKKFLHLKYQPPTPPPRKCKNSQNFQWLWLLWSLIHTHIHTQLHEKTLILYFQILYLCSIINVWMIDLCFYGNRFLFLGKFWLLLVGRMWVRLY